MSAENALTVKAQAHLVDSLCCSFDIFDPRTVTSHTEEKANLLRFLVEGKYVQRKLVENAVLHRLLELGEDMYSRHLKNHESPDHLGSRDVFGFYLQTGRVPVEVIQFDHGETAEEYVKSSEGLVDSVIEQLFNYKKPKPIVLSGDGDCLCCHH